MRGTTSKLFLAFCINNKIMKQLCRIGLRKCYGCKRILKLNSDNFYKGDSVGFKKLCKDCEKKRKQTPKFKAHRRRYYQETKEKTKKRRLKLRFEILAKYNFTCQYCGRKAPEVILEIDHKYPKSKGGLSKIENYTVACKECNIGKGDCILDEFKK